MKLFWAMVLSLVLSGAGASGAAWACKGMGDNTHVGVITQVSAEEGRLTITDAETRGPIEFSAASAMLTPLNVGDRVVVSYETRDGKLIATTVTL
jgi:hypothetical protein